MDCSCDAFLALVQPSLCHSSYFDVKEQQLSSELLHRSAVSDEDVLTRFRRFNLVAALKLFLKGFEKSM